jgi:hypothetical protein
MRWHINNYVGVVAVLVFDVVVATVDETMWLWKHRMW